MKPGIQALREHRNELSRQANEKLAAKGDAVWTKDDKAAFDAIADEMERVDGQIASTQRLLDLQAEESFDKIDEFRRPGDRAQKTPAALAVEAFIRKSDKQLTNEEAMLIRNTMSTTTGSEGGYTVPSEISNNLIDLLKGYGAMRKTASQITTGHGRDMSFPTSDGTSETGEWIAQNNTATAADPTFGTKAVNVYKASSKIIAVPIELLQDTVIDIIGFLNQRIRDRIGRLANVGFTTGSGSAQPNGVVTAASVGKTGTTGQTTTIIYDDLVDLIDSIDVAYLDEGGSGLCFQTNQTLRKTIRKIKDTAGRPIWTPSYDAGMAKGLPDQLMGYDLVINNDFATPAANAKSMAFGNFKKYLIRDAMQVTLFRFEDSAYVKLGQIGFLAWARMGGNLLDTNAVKLYQHSAT